MAKLIKPIDCPLYARWVDVEDSGQGVHGVDALLSEAYQVCQDFWSQRPRLAAVLAALEFSEQSEHLHHAAGDGLGVDGLSQASAGGAGLLDAAENSRQVDKAPLKVRQ